MPDALSEQDWRAYAAEAIDRAQWTAIIPAAGRGSRLGFDKPKILYPVAGRMIIEWLLAFLTPHCARIVLVLSPDGCAAVERELARIIPDRYTIAIQEAPTGMGDAVAIGLARAATEHVAIVWGDQVALRRRSVEACCRVHQGSLEPILTFPTVVRPNPYIHFVRDESGGLSGLLQKREGDAMPAEGESDTGFFCFRAEPLRALFAELRASDSSKGNATGEFNFLPVIPLAARRGGVVTPRVVTLEETVGVNSKEDAALVEAFLLNKSC